MSYVLRNIKWHNASTNTSGMYTFLHAWSFQFFKAPPKGKNQLTLEYKVTHVCILTLQACFKQGHNDFEKQVDSCRCSGNKVQGFSSLV